MHEPLTVYIGFDSKEPAAFHVLSHSILTRASEPVRIVPLRQDTLRQAGIYTRERGPTESTEFSLTRFLVPYLSGFQGHSVFLDCDMLCRVDITDLWDEISRQMECRNEYHWPRRAYTPFKAVLVCQHDYQPSQTVKFLGNAQTVYPRKNWSSFMVFDNARCKALTPEYVNTATGLELHRFQWLKDEQIGTLPLTWNWLVGEYPVNNVARVLHYTLGAPCHPGYENCDHAEEWFAERDAAFGAGVAA
jgi:hypothetical protein